MRWRTSRPKSKIEPERIKLSADRQSEFDEKVFGAVKYLTERMERSRRDLEDGVHSFIDPDFSGIHPQKVMNEIFGLFGAKSAAEEAGRRLLIRNTLKRLARIGRLETYMDDVYLNLNSFGDHHFGVIGQHRRVTCYRPGSLLITIALAARAPSEKKRRAHHSR